MTLVRHYVMTRETSVQLTRDIEFTRIPCAGEWFRLKSSGIFSSEVTEVIHDENGNAEIVIGPQTDHEGRLLFHETAEDLQRDVDDLVKDGWRLVSQAPNKFWGKRTRTLKKRETLRTRPDDPDRA